MKKNNQHYSKALNHTFLYSIANILRKVVGFLMLPIYTSYLSPEDYGAVELMMMLIVFMEIFIAMRMGQAIFRFYCMTDNEVEKKTIMSTAYLISFITGGIAYFLLACFSDNATTFVLGDIKYSHLVQILAFLLLGQALEEFGMLYLRAQQRPIYFLVISLIKLLTSLSLNIYFIVYLDMSIKGVVYSACISTGIIALFSTIYTLYYAGISFSKKIAIRLFLFTYPLWISAFATFYADSAVKYFLRVFSGLDTVGIYVLAAKFSALLILFVWGPFLNIWQSLRYEVYKGDDPIGAFRHIFINLVLALLFIGLSISLFSETVIVLMSTQQFWSAGSIVPILVASSTLMALSNFNNLGVLLKQKTSVIALSTYMNAIVITLCFYFLVPAFGIIGAAFSSLIGQLTKLIWIEYKSNQLYDMQLPWKQASSLACLCIIIYSVSLFLPDNFVISIIGKIILITLFLWLSFKLPILKDNDKDHIYSSIGSILHKFKLRMSN